MPTSVKNSTALLASVIHAIFIVSHALRYEISHASSSRHESEPLTLGWISGTKYRFPTPHQQRRRERSTTIRVGRCTTHHGKRAISSRHRSKSRMMSLSDVGFDDVVPPTTKTLPSAGCTSTSSRATTAAESSTSSPARQTSPLMESQRSGEVISAQLKMNTDARSKGRAAGSGNASPLGTRAVMSSSSGGSVTSTQVAAVASADMADLDEAAQMDEGSAICKRIESITREMEINGQRILLRVATLEDYQSIADVRFSVFSPVHMTLRKRFRDRSCVLMKERRYRGSFCLVAVSEDSDAEGFDPLGAEGKAKMKDEGRGAEVARHGRRHEQVLGTLECSKHEFEETPLALEGDEISRLYLTEVAVREECRRLGLGSGLLTLVEDVARHLNTREIYLHVNEINEAATSLYTRCGYEDAPSCPSSRAFTTKLGLSGGFYGQRHRLMRKMIAGAGYNDEDDNDGRDDENNDDDESPPTESTV